MERLCERMVRRLTAGREPAGNLSDGRRCPTCGGNLVVKASRRIGLETRQQRRECKDCRAVFTAFVRIQVIERVFAMAKTVRRRTTGPAQGEATPVNKSIDEPRGAKETWTWKNEPGGSSNCFDQETLSCAQFAELCKLTNVGGQAPHADGCDPSGEPFWNRATITDWAQHQARRFRSGTRPPTAPGLTCAASTRPN